MTEVQMVMSHSTGCSGWDLSFMEDLGIWGGVNTSKAEYFGHEDRCLFLDFDFRNPDIEKHVRMAQKYDFKLCMAPDVMAHHDLSDIMQVLDVVNALRRYCDRVVIPVHKWHPILEGYELAFPNAPSFSPDNELDMQKIRPHVTHILGGSPKKQRQALHFFPNVKSVDGNQVFQVANRAGKYWSADDHKWKKPKQPATEISNEEIFKMSVKNWKTYITKTDGHQPTIMEAA